MDISVVIPTYGCPGAVEEMHERLTATLSEMNVEYEIIMVDDHCPLNSWDPIKKVCEKDKHVKGIRFSRNFGQMMAISAGVSAATGDYVVTMDCDLQDVPENIPRLYEKIKEGYNVVFARRKERKDSKLTQFWGRIFHKVFSYLSELDFDFDLATFLMADRKAVNDYLTSNDRGRDFGMYMMWLGYSRAFVDCEHGDRHSGKSTYTFSKKVNYALKTITTYSNRVLYIPIYIGVISAIGSFAYLIYVMYTYFVMKLNPEGWTTIVSAIFLFGGLILSMLGIIGIYLGNIFDISKARPLYVIQETINE